MQTIINARAVKDEEPWSSFLLDEDLHTRVTRDRGVGRKGCRGAQPKTRGALTTMYNETSLRFRVLGGLRGSSIQADLPDGLREISLRCSGSLEMCLRARAFLQLDGNPGPAGEWGRRQGFQDRTHASVR
eukprot:185351-Lingulodinium_polyedra.AAC.1